MISCSFLLFLSVITVGLSTIHVSALKAEGIANGSPVEHATDFPHQVAIFASKYRNQKPMLRCNGALVAAGWVLSIAHCFMENSKDLEQLTFTAVVGENVADPPIGFSQVIVYIYTDEYDSDNYANDITLAKTLNDFKLTVTVQTVNYPHHSDFYMGHAGYVSGYGCSDLQTRNDSQSLECFDDAETDLKLKYTIVQISNSRDCVSKFSRASADDKVCGIAKYINGKYTGMCWNDAGNPLIVDGKVVALSVLSYADCNDTGDGSLYVDVADHYHFIDRVLKNNKRNSYTKHKF